MTTSALCRSIVIPAAILSSVLCCAPARSATDGPAPWPASREALLFLWVNGNRPAVAYDAAGKSIYAYSLTNRGAAFEDHNYAMLLCGGSYTAPELEPFLAGSIKRKAQLSLEITAAPAHIEQNGVLLALASRTGSCGLTVVQEGARIIARLHTPGSPEPKSVTLATVTGHQPIHLAVTYGAGKLTGYQDGKPTSEPEHAAESLGAWNAGQLSLGATWAGVSPWLGHVEGIALYGRDLSPAAVQKDAIDYLARVKERKPIASLEMKGRLLARPKIPTYKEIAPYSRALAVFEYSVDEVIAGKYARPKIRVARWVMLDGKPAGVANAPIGAHVHLHLQLYESNPQLESEYISDTLPETNAPIYYDPSME